MHCFSIYKEYIFIKKNTIKLLRGYHFLRELIIYPLNKKTKS